MIPLPLQVLFKQCFLETRVFSQLCYSFLWLSFTGMATQGKTSSRLQGISFTIAHNRKHSVTKGSLFHKRLTLGYGKHPALSVNVHERSSAVSAKAVFLLLLALTPWLLSHFLPRITRGRGARGLHALVSSWHVFNDTMELMTVETKPRKLLIESYYLMFINHK